MSLPMVEIASESGDTRARFVPGANLLCCSLTHRDAELLDPRAGIDAYAEHGKTMGIPLLYPWANRLSGYEFTAAGRKVELPIDPEAIPSDPHGLPIHGILPSRMRWEADTGSDRLTAHLDWNVPALMELFPFVHEVRVDVVVGQGELHVQTVVAATGGDPVPVSFGYHPYLRLPGRPRSACVMELPGCQRLLLDERSIPTGKRDRLGPATLTLGESSWDDGLQPDGLPARFATRAGSISVVLELLQGYPFAQVFAPPDAGFVCFEPMTAPTDALHSGDGLTVLEPGQEHRSAFRIAVEGV